MKIASFEGKFATSASRLTQLDDGDVTGLLLRSIIALFLCLPAHCVSRALFLESTCSERLQIWSSSRVQRDSYPSTKADLPNGFPPPLSATCAYASEACAVAEMHRLNLICRVHRKDGVGFPIKVE